MPSLFEQPLVLIAIGAAVLLVMFGILQQTGKRWVFYAMIAVVVLFAGLLVLERQIVTPAESVRSTIYAIAADAQRNDIAAVVERISRRAPETKTEVEARLRVVRLEEIKIKQIDNLVVRLNDNPPSASARVQALAVGRDRLETQPRQRVPRAFQVKFVLEDNVWKVRSYEDLGDGLRGE
jgi:hypothetical protein